MTDIQTSETVAQPVSQTLAASTPAFIELGLAPELIQALTASGYTHPTPIQAKAIPPLLKGKDLLGLAETGTGKTAAFALPILEALSKIKEPVAPKTCRALILAPTRELAIQIGESIETYGKHLNLRHTVIFGGVGSRPQVRAMERGVDILVATPGRLLDLMGMGQARLNRVTHFVLDEADRMLDMGFIRDVKRIVKELPKVRQSLLFSATMPADITELAHELLHNPVRVEIARAGKTVDRIEQLVYYVATPQKRAALAALLKNEEMRRVIVFARTKHGADRVARGLGASGVGAYAIHGNKSQNARQAALENFRTGEARVLVATDIAARGIDIDDITHVINYDLPNIPESYVHRIGRTARAGNSGIAIALCAPEERAYLRDIERLTKKPLTQGPAIAGLAEVAASLPPIPSKRAGQDDGAHFERAKGHVAKRRHMPAERPNTVWHEGSAPRVDAAKPRDDRPRGERSFGRDRDDRGGPRDRKPFGERREGGFRPRDGERSFEGRPRGQDSDRPRKPWSDRGPDRDRGPREGGQGDGARQFRPRDDRPRDDRPQGDRPQKPWERRDNRPHGARGPRSDGDAPRGKPSDGFEPRKRAFQRPEGERQVDRGADRRDERSFQKGPRTDFRGERRHHGDRRDERPREARSFDKPRGDRPQGDRAPRAFDKPHFEKPWQRRDGEQRAERPQGDRRPQREHGNRDGQPSRARGMNDRPRGDFNRDRPRKPRPEGQGAPGEKSE